MPERQHTTPMIVRGDEARALRRLPLASKDLSEKRLQELLYEHPALLPIGEIEPAFAEPVALARELRTASGPVDLVYINDRGLLTLVETKLWRNPEARRKVVAQIIDYAKDVARWSYSDLLDAIKKGHAPPSDDPIIEAVGAVTDDFAESVFIDRVQRNMRRGRFLLLIVGDGIHEGVERMAEFLQQTPQLGYTLGLVELAIYQLEQADSASLLIQPRIIARTQEVVRAIVEVRGETASQAIDVSIPPPEGDGDGGGGGRSPITEQVFLEELASATDPQTVEFARWALDKARKRKDLQIEWGDAGPVFKYIDTDTGHDFNLGKFDRRGLFIVGRFLTRRCQRLGLPESSWRPYLERVAKLIPGATCKRHVTAKLDVWLVLTGSSPVKDAPKLRALAERREGWFEAIDVAIENIQAALEAMEEETAG